MYEQNKDFNDTHFLSTSLLENDIRSYYLRIQHICVNSKILYIKIISQNVIIKKFSQILNVEKLVIKNITEVETLKCYKKNEKYQIQDYFQTEFYVIIQSFTSTKNNLQKYSINLSEVSLKI